MKGKAIAALLGAVVAAASVWLASDGALSSSGTVVQSVADGDTITVLVDGTREKVRLIGIDTPETVDPKRPVGCFGKEASSFTKEVLPKGTKVRLELDVEPRDRYGRMLAYVYRESDGLFVNGELARLGYAQPLTIPPNVAHTETFTMLASEARRNNVGLWASCADP